MPGWLTWLAVASLLAGGICALIIAIDLLTGHKQHMWIMNVVWPVTALYSGPLGLWAYYRMGRLSSAAAVRKAKQQNRKMSGMDKPFWQKAALAATHCGSGCTLGDIMAEWIIFALPLSLFGMKMFGAWTLDFAFAYLLGIVFQYFTIAPMRGLSLSKGLAAAIKADTLSLTSWQAGMYGWMAIATFVIFGHELNQTEPVFWFMMQIAMLVGFATAYPVNRWLLNKGIKEPM